MSASRTSQSTKENLHSALALFLPMLLLYGYGNFLRTGIPGTIYNQLLNEARLDAVQISFISIACIWVYSLSQIFVGFLVDKFGGVRVLLCGGLLLVSGAMLFPCAHTPTLMYLGQVMVGLGSGTIFLSALKEADHRFAHRHHATVLGVLYFSTYFGGILATLPFAWGCHHFSWRLILLIIALFAVAVYASLVRAAHRQELPSPRPGKFSLRPLTKILLNRNSWLAAVACDITFASYFVIQTIFGMKFLQDFCGLSSLAASSAILLLTVVCTLGVLCCGGICRIFDNRRRPPIILGVCANFFAMMLMLVAVGLHAPAWPFVLGYVCCAIANSLCSPLCMLLMQELNSDEVEALAPGFNNMFAFLLASGLTFLLGICLAAFPHHVGAEGRNVFAPEAYATVFAMLACLAAVSLVVACKIPETHGENVWKD